VVGIDDLNYLYFSWANNKVYAVGRTLRRIMLKEALTYDYK
jgi:hypothetical protein